jgi:hypothetical protein
MSCGSSYNTAWRCEPDAAAEQRTASNIPGVIAASTAAHMEFGLDKAGMCNTNKGNQVRKRIILIKYIIILNKLQVPGKREREGFFSVRLYRQGERHAFCLFHKTFPKRNTPLPDGSLAFCEINFKMQHFCNVGGLHA